MEKLRKRRQNTGEKEHEGKRKRKKAKGNKPERNRRNQERERQRRENRREKTEAMGERPLRTRHGRAGDVIFAPSCDIHSIIFLSSRPSLYNNKEKRKLQKKKRRKGTKKNCRRMETGWPAWASIPHNKRWCRPWRPPLYIVSLLIYVFCLLP